MDWLLLAIIATALLAGYLADHLGPSYGAPAHPRLRLLPRVPSQEHYDAL